MPLSCDGCVKDVSEALYKVPGISKVEGNLEDQLVSIEGTGNLPLFDFFSSFRSFSSLEEREPFESLIIDLGFKP